MIITYLLNCKSVRFKKIKANAPKSQKKTMKGKSKKKKKEKKLFLSLKSRNDVNGDPIWLVLK
jgi:hypothetical protein